MRVRVSSGKTTSERPPSQAARAPRRRVAKLRERVSRSTGMKPAAAMDQPRIGRRKRLRLARNRTDMGSTAKQHQDVVEALVVGGDHEARAARASRSACRTRTAHAGHREDHAAPSRAPASGTTRRAGGTSASGIAGRPKRIVAAEMTIQTPSERRKRHGGGCVAEATSPGASGVYTARKRRRRMRRPHGSTRTVRDGDLLSQPRLAAVRGPFRPQGLARSSTTSAAWRELVGQAIVGCFTRPFYADRGPAARWTSSASSRVAITGITALFTGMVLALQTAYSLEAFGGKMFVGRVVSLSLVRELGPVLTALMVGGRVGLGHHGRDRLDDGHRAGRRPARDGDLPGPPPRRAARRRRSCS